MKSHTPKKNHQEQCLKIFLSKLFQQQFKTMKLPKSSSLFYINKQFLVTFPDTLYFEFINIISSEKKISKELSSCFISDAFNEIDKLKEKLYQSLYDNSSHLSDNMFILQSISDVINALPKDAFISKYISLISCFTNKMDKENAIICKILVLFPSNYEQLCSRINIALNLANLPEDPVNFYSISNYQLNIRNFEAKISKDENPKDSTNQTSKSYKDELNSLKSEFINLLSLKDQKHEKELKDLREQVKEQVKELNGLREQVKDLSEELKETKFSLFQIQLRDIIKEFLKEVRWSFGLKAKKPDDQKEELKELLEGMTSGEEESKKLGAKVILTIIENCISFKSDGDDSGHYVKNIGFNEKKLPEGIQDLYTKYKKKSHYIIKNCDIISMILSIGKINHSADNSDETNKMYKLFDDIFSLDKKDLEGRKEKIKSIIINYF